jgi:lysophospholipase L1-like esterase
MSCVQGRLRHVVVRAASACAVFVGVVASGCGSGSAETVVRIMPLGDSLTDGYQVPGGYRVALEERLAAAGITVDFVGSLRNGPASPGAGSLRDRDHEGHSGWRIDEVGASVEGWIRTYRPEVVLLLLGTNDVLQDLDLATAPARLAALVDRIHELRPATTVVVSSLPPLADPTDDAQARAYNAELAGLVRRRAAAGRPVRFVDSRSAVSRADLSDGVHLTARGYSKLAGAWLPALLAALGRGEDAVAEP